MNIIEVERLVKEFQVSDKQKGLKGAVKALFVSKKHPVRAVDDISFSIACGETVGYIGPNGAGKSTTIKMMAGILTPSSGRVLVNGLDPQRERKQVVRNLGVVFGQRSQLYWDLRLGESFELLRRIYRIPQEVYERNLALMDEMLQINSLVNTPVRQLSLGQRMRGDLAAAILHSPPVLFLDEPTIGLDIDAKHAVRRFIRDINRTHGTTVILTTHDLDDIKELCSRIIIINHGKIVEDGSLDNLIGRIAPLRRLTVTLESEAEIAHSCAEVVKHDGAKITLQFRKEEISASELIADISRDYKITDLSLEEADIEDIIKIIYNS